eukprot:gene13105-15476_t
MYLLADEEKHVEFLLKDCSGDSEELGNGSCSSDLDSVPEAAMDSGEDLDDDVQAAGGVFSSTPDFAGRAQLHNQTQLQPLCGQAPYQQMHRGLLDSPSAKAQFESDVEMGCGQLALARAAAHGFTSPVYLGRISQPPSSPFPFGTVFGLPPSIGAFHNWDFITATRCIHDRNVPFAASWDWDFPA